jgi:thiosulfate/3-mercaptopyruvate sulfurtransferase
MLTAETARHLRDKGEVSRIVAEGREQLVDARSRERFEGGGTDPVHGGAGGHIPGSRSLPYTELFGEDGRYLPPDRLHSAFERAGIDPDRPVTASCGSGVTACNLLFALDRIGAERTALYDGGWREWGNDPETPKETGAPP